MKRGLTLLGTALMLGAIGCASSAAQPDVQATVAAAISATMAAAPVPTQVPPSPIPPAPTVTLVPTVAPRPADAYLIGDTIPYPANASRLMLKLTFVGWRETAVALDTYISGPHTFTATAGKKFVQLALRFENQEVQALKTPYLRSGMLRTTSGAFYPVWAAVGGVNNTAYSPRRSTDAEVSTLLFEGALKPLLPSQRIEDAVTFEVPVSDMPEHVTLEGVRWPVLIASTPPL